MLRKFSIVSICIKDKLMKALVSSAEQQPGSAKGFQSQKLGMQFCIVVICSTDFLYPSGNFPPNNVYFLLKLKTLGSILSLSNPIPLLIPSLAITDELCLSIAPKHVYFIFFLCYIFYILDQMLNEHKSFHGVINC